jgi:hypothetical protein
VDARIGRFSVSPRDLGRLRGLSPQRPVTGTARISGPLTALNVAAEMSPGRGRIRLRGRLDARTRRGRADLTVDQLETDFLPVSAVTITSATVHVESVGRPGAITVELRGRGAYQRALIDPSLGSAPAAAKLRELGRFARIEPGGRITVEGHAELNGEVRGSFRAWLSDPGSTARVVAGVPLPPPAHPNLMVVGRFQKPRRGPARLRVHTTPLHLGRLPRGAP